MSAKKIKAGSRRIEVSNPDKVFFPDEGITKGDVAEYYRRIAETMLPHMRDRPLNMQRFPDGIEKDGFYEKKVPDYFPGWIDSASVYLKEKKRRQRQVVCNDAATLLYLADKACISAHLWLSRKDDLRRPDRLIFDLDPPDGDFDPVRAGARAIKEIIEQAGLTAFVMTTGSRGLHVVAPLDRSAGFDSVRSFARKAAELLARKEPERFTTETRKEKRKGRLFLDYLRNAYAQTAVAPYAIRPKPGAPVATPLEWDELSDGSLDARRFTIRNIFRRLGQREDPWKRIDRGAASLKEANRQLKQLSED